MSSLPKIDREIAVSASAKKIVELTNPESDIKKALIHIQMLAGCTMLDPANPVDKMTLTFITGQILKYYERFTVEEIVKAAELNALGEYPEKVKAFGTITWDFICDLMKHYKVRKQATMAELNRRESDKLAGLPETPPDPEKAYNGLKMVFYETGKEPIGWDYSSAYDWAWSNKLFSQSREEMATWYETEAQAIRSDITRQIASCSNFIERQALEKKRTGTWVKQECRKRWMIKHMIELLNK